MIKKKPRENDTFITSAEYQVLALIIRNPEMDLELRRNDFPHAKAQTIFRALQALRETGEEMNFGSILREANRIDSSIDASYVSSILAFEVTEKNFEKAVEVLAQASLKYKASLVLDTLASKIESFENLNPDTINEYLSKVQDVFQRGQKKSTLKTIEEVFRTYIEELRQRKIGRFYPFNDLFLDTHLTRRGAPGQVILIAGTTGTGKSIAGLNLVNGGLEIDTPMIYCSLEMDEISTAERLACLRTGVPVEEWYKRDMIDSLIELVEKEILDTLNKRFGFTDDPSMSIPKFEQMIINFKKKYGVDYLIAYIDLVTQVREFVNLGKGSTMATAIELAVNKLNVVAKRQNVCIVAIAQMGRNKHNPKINNIEQIEELRPSLEQIKNSNALGERSRVVLSVFRPKYFAMQLLPNDPEVEFMVDELEMQILKQNMGGSGMVGKYIFDGATSSLRPVPPEVPEHQEED